MQPVGRAVGEDDVLRRSVDQPADRLLEASWYAREALGRHLPRGSLPGDRLLGLGARHSAAAPGARSSATPGHRRGRSEPARGLSPSRSTSFHPSPVSRIPRYHFARQRCSKRRARGAATLASQSDNRANRAKGQRCRTERTRLPSEYWARSTTCRRRRDACAGTDNPFIGHAFLAALEYSGSVCAKTGWLPHHLALRRRRLAGGGDAAVPEEPLLWRVRFDWGWAEAYERAGGRYYPKLQAAVPLRRSPAGGFWFARTRPRRPSVRSRPRRSVWRSGSAFPRCTSPFRRRRKSRRCARRASWSAWVTSSTGKTVATPASTISSATLPRASARPCARSDSRWRHPASFCGPSTGRDQGTALGRLLALLSRYR